MRLIIVFSFIDFISFLLLEARLMVPVDSTAIVNAAYTSFWSGGIGLLLRRRRGRRVYEAR